jgi:hypothetical protein
MSTLPTNIDDVLKELDSIILETTNDNNYLGIFAYVYRRTTAEIKNAIAGKQFTDNERMERMDVTFANKYISAYHHFKSSTGPVAGAWVVPFQSGSEKLTVMQHLLMGMNAHINFDLGVAASETVPGDAIDSLKADFMKVNDILAGLTHEMQVKTGRISWWMFLLDWIGGNKDEAVINFSMIKARKAAWNFAVTLSSLQDDTRTLKMEQADAVTAALAEIIKRPPGFLLRNILNFMSAFEEKDVKRIIARLEE